MRRNSSIVPGDMQRAAEKFDREREERDGEKGAEMKEDISP